MESSPQPPRNPRGRPWSFDETKLAFYLYCQLPFGRLHSRNPEIVNLASLLERTPGAVAMKLTNFAGLDPDITATGRRGLSNSSETDRAVWEEFNSDWGTLATDCERRIRELAGGHPDAAPVVEEEGASYILDDYTGTTRASVTQRRVKQQFFRRAVLSSYDGRCCMSGLADPELLVASHIVPWHSDAGNRLNPSNGLCLSAIHDRAFDQYLVSLTDDLRVLVSDRLKKHEKSPFVQSAFLDIEGEFIQAPRRFRPSAALVQHHRQTYLDMNS